MVYPLALCAALVAGRVGPRDGDSNISLNSHGIDPFLKRHRLVHNGEFPKFEALYFNLNMVN